MCAFQRGNVNSNQQSVQVYTLSEGASCMHFALTVGEKKIFKEVSWKVGFLYTDKKIETYQKWNKNPLKNMM